MSGSNETMQVIGVKDGVETIIGTATITPRMKARDLVHENIGGFEDGDGSEADVAFSICRWLLEWMGENPPVINMTAPTVRDGWQLVPTDPPREMMEAAPSLPAINVVADKPLAEAGWSMAAIMNRKRYLAMLAAAPSHQGGAA